ncbi:MAG: MarR family transcriptional regulator [Acidobacteria bacterium]|nr:MarR family transcriptional regulator [Acidobacteriota bacterium]
MERWTFLTNHAHVLLSIAADPGIRLRDVAARVGVTERAAQRIVADLLAEGYLTAEKAGRRNHYEVHKGLPLRHPVEQHAEVGALLRLLGAKHRRGARAL